MRYVVQTLATAAAFSLLPLCRSYGALPVGPIDPQAPVRASTTSAPSTDTGARLPTGVRLPSGAVRLGAPATSDDREGRHQWRVDVRLDGLTAPAAPAALTFLAETLGNQGWEVREGRADVFAIRRVAGRWELFKVWVDPARSRSFHGAVLTDAGRADHRPQSSFGGVRCDLRIVDRLPGL